MGSAAAAPLAASVDALVCEACGRAPARKITARRHVGLLFVQQFVTTPVVACRPCGRTLVRSYTRKTLWQGWWGWISFFFNWFVLASNAAAWLKLKRLPEPTLSGSDLSFEPAADWGGEDEDEESRKSSRLPAIVGGLAGAAFGLFALVGWGWDATHHDHEGGHGRPAMPAEVAAALPGPAQAEDGSPVMVAAAECKGHGEAVRGGFTHFLCQLTFANGDTDEVVVHLLPGDELMYVSAMGVTP